MRGNRISAFLLAALVVLTVAGCGQKAQPEAPPAPPEPAIKDLILSTTTSTQDSGLLDELIPIFEEKTGYLVKTVAVGTGKALEMASLGEADVLLVHAPAAEKEKEAAGDVISRQLVMHNDFIIVGSDKDAAKIKDVKSVEDAFKAIMDTKSAFVSRGDDSGTHKMEKGLWKKIEIEPEGDWYVEAGSGMGDTLKIASEKAGYTLTDRATYLALKDTLDLEILFEGDNALLNVYHVMQVNPDKFDKINADGAKAFAEFMVADDTQKVISEFGVDKFGQPLFFPDAGKPDQW